MSEVEKFLINGLIDKKSPSGLRLYQTRFFSLDMVNGIMTYYQNEAEYNNDAHNYSGTVSIIAAQEVKYNGKRDLSIRTINSRIKPPHRTFELRFSTEALALFWISKIGSVISTFNIQATLVGFPSSKVDHHLFNMRTIGRSSILRIEDQYELALDDDNDLLGVNRASEPNQTTDETKINTYMNDTVFHSTPSKAPSKGLLQDNEADLSSVMNNSLLDSQNQAPISSHYANVWIKTGKSGNATWLKSHLVLDPAMLNLYRNENAYINDDAPRISIPTTNIVGVAPMTFAVGPQEIQNVLLKGFGGLLVLSSDGTTHTFCCLDFKDRDVWLSILSHWAAANIQNRLQTASEVMPSVHNIIMHGWLLKKGNSVPFKAWRDRYFVLNSERLTYFTSVPDERMFTAQDNVKGRETMSPADVIHVLNNCRGFIPCSAVTGITMKYVDDQPHKSNLPRTMPGGVLPIDVESGLALSTLELCNDSRLMRLSIVTHNRVYEVDAPNALTAQKWYTALLCVCTSKITSHGVTINKHSRKLPSSPTNLSMSTSPIFTPSPLRQHSSFKSPSFVPTNSLSLPLASPMSSLDLSDPRSSSFSILPASSSSSPNPVQTPVHSEPPTPHFSYPSCPTAPIKQIHIADPSLPSTLPYAVNRAGEMLRPVDTLSFSVSASYCRPPNSTLPNKHIDKYKEWAMAVIKHAKSSTQEQNIIDTSKKVKELDAKAKKQLEMRRKMESRLGESLTTINNSSGDDYDDDETPITSPAVVADMLARKGPFSDKAQSAMRMLSVPTIDEAGDTWFASMSVYAGPGQETGLDDVVWPDALSAALGSGSRGWMGTGGCGSHTGTWGGGDWNGTHNKRKEKKKKDDKKSKDEKNKDKHKDRDLDDDSDDDEEDIPPPPISSVAASANFGVGASANASTTWREVGRTEVRKPVYFEDQLRDIKKLARSVGESCVDIWKPAEESQKYSKSLCFMCGHPQLPKDLSVIPPDVDRNSLSFCECMHPAITRTPTAIAAKAWQQHNASLSSDSFTKMLGESSITDSTVCPFIAVPPTDENPALAVPPSHASIGNINWSVEAPPTPPHLLLGPAANRFTTLLSVCVENDGWSRPFTEDDILLWILGEETINTYSRLCRIRDALRLRQKSLDSLNSAASDSSNSISMTEVPVSSEWSWLTDEDVSQFIAQYPYHRHIIAAIRLHLRNHPQLAKTLTLIPALSKLLSSRHLRLSPYYDPALADLYSEWINLDISTRKLLSSHAMAIADITKNWLDSAHSFAPPPTSITKMLLAQAKTGGIRSKSAQTSDDPFLSEPEDYPEDEDEDEDTFEDDFDLVTDNTAPILMKTLSSPTQEEGQCKPRPVIPPKPAPFNRPIPPPATQPRGQHAPTSHRQTATVFNSVRVLSQTWQPSEMAIEEVPLEDIVIPVSSSASSYIGISSFSHSSNGSNHLCASLNYAPVISIVEDQSPEEEEEILPPPPALDKWEVEWLDWAWQPLINDIDDSHLAPLPPSLLSYGVQDLAQLLQSASTEPSNHSDTLSDLLFDVLYYDGWKHGSDRTLDKTLIKVTVYRGRKVDHHQSSLKNYTELGSTMFTIGDVLREPGGILRKSTMFVYNKDQRFPGHIEISFASCQSTMLSNTDKYMYHNTMMTGSELTMRGSPSQDASNNRNDGRYAPLSTYQSLPTSNSDLPANQVLQQYLVSPLGLASYVIPRHYLMVVHESLQTPNATYAIPLQVIQGALTSRQRQYCFLHHTLTRVKSQLMIHRGIIGDVVESKGSENSVPLLNLEKLSCGCEESGVPCQQLHSPSIPLDSHQDVLYNVLEGLESFMLSHITMYNTAISTGNLQLLPAQDSETVSLISLARRLRKIGQSNGDADPHNHVMLYGSLHSTEAIQAVQDEHANLPSTRRVHSLHIICHRIEAAMKECKQTIDVYRNASKHFAFTYNQHAAWERALGWDNTRERHYSSYSSSTSLSQGNSFSNSLAQINKASSQPQVYTPNQDGVSINPATLTLFKPSTAKSDVMLDYIPTNLHQQLTKTYRIPRRRPCFPLYALEDKSSVDPVHILHSPSHNDILFIGYKPSTDPHTIPVLAPFIKPIANHNPPNTDSLRSALTALTPHFPLYSSLYGLPSQRLYSPFDQLTHNALSYVPELKSVTKDAVIRFNTRTSPNNSGNPHLSANDKLILTFPRFARPYTSHLTIMPTTTVGIYASHAQSKVSGLSLHTHPLLMLMMEITSHWLPFKRSVQSLVTRAEATVVANTLKTALNTSPLPPQTQQALANAVTSVTSNILPLVTRLEYMLATHHRRSVAVFSQALSSTIATINSLLCSNDPSMLSLLPYTGFLVPVESLVTAFQQEYDMMADAEWVSYQLSRVGIRIVCSEADIGYDFIQEGLLKAQRDLDRKIEPSSEAVPEVFDNDNLSQTDQHESKCDLVHPLNTSSVALEESILNPLSFHDRNKGRETFSPELLDNIANTVQSHTLTLSPSSIYSLMLARLRRTCDTPNGVMSLSILNDHEVTHSTNANTIDIEDDSSLALNNLFARIRGLLDHPAVNHAWTSTYMFKWLSSIHTSIHTTATHIQDQVSLIDVLAEKSFNLKLARSSIPTTEYPISVPTSLASVSTPITALNSNVIEAINHIPASHNVSQHTFNAGHIHVPNNESAGSGDHLLFSPRMTELEEDGSNIPDLSFGDRGAFDGYYSSDDEDLIFVPAQKDENDTCGNGCISEDDIESPNTYASNLIDDEVMLYSSFVDTPPPTPMHQRELSRDISFIDIPVDLNDNEVDNKNLPPSMSSLIVNIHVPLSLFLLLPDALTGDKSKTLAISTAHAVNKHLSTETPTSPIDMAEGTSEVYKQDHQVPVYAHVPVVPLSAPIIAQSVNEFTAMATLTGSIKKQHQMNSDSTITIEQYVSRFVDVQRFASISDRLQWAVAHLNCTCMGANTPVVERKRDMAWLTACCGSLECKGIENNCVECLALMARLHSTSARDNTKCSHPISISPDIDPSNTVCRCTCHALDICTCTPSKQCIACSYNQSVSNIHAKIAYLQSLTSLFAKHVNESQVEAKRDVAIHTIAAQICRTVGTARVVSCKSAKDRTSMSVTWETIRTLMNSGMPIHAALQLLDIFRTFGVRRSNVIKNTGKKKYAFNGLQRNRLPPILSPPSYTCSGKIES